MLAIFRLTLLLIVFIIITSLSCLYSILRPFHRNNVHYTAKYLGKVTKILGFDVEVRIPESVKNIGPVVYVANHQNNYDLLTMSNAVQPGTVTVGKKSLKWIPFFGQMYWLTGNILIDRANTNKAIGTMSLAAQKIEERKLSVWMFPEGTRSLGRGLLRFKTGAFRTAAQAGVPIVPVCSSSIENAIDLSRWDNGKVIIELLDPLYINDTSRDSVRDITDKTHEIMKAKISQLDDELSKAQ